MDNVEKGEIKKGGGGDFLGANRERSPHPGLIVCP